MTSEYPDQTLFFSPRALEFKSRSMYIEPASISASLYPLYLYLKDVLGMYATNIIAALGVPIFDPWGRIASVNLSVLEVSWIGSNVFFLFKK